MSGLTLRGKGLDAPRHLRLTRADDYGGVPMTATEISLKVDEAVWNELRNLARETKRSVSEVLSEAIEDYLARRRARPDVLRHLEDSMRENEELGKLLE